MHRVRSLFVPAICAVVIFVSFYRLGSVSLFDVDEAVFAEATKEMVQTGNWITPTYNGENRYDKPILFYWLMAGSYKIFGVNEFGARFPSASAGLLLSIAIYLFMGRCAGREAAFYSAAAFVLSPYFLVYSYAAVTDMVLTLFISVSLFFFFLSGSSGGDAARSTDSRLYGFYLFSALAFLTKGLIGIVFPFSIAVVYLMLRKGWRDIGRLFRPGPILLFLIVSAPWYIAQFAINGREFFDQFFMKHHFMRYTGVISGHRGPLIYYIPVLIIGLFPWIGFLPAGIGNAQERGHLREVSGITRESAFSLPVPLKRFALAWLGIIVLFFSFSTTKLPNYILPATPAASIIIGAGMSGLRNRWTRFSYGFISLAAASAAVAFIASRGYLAGAGVSDTGWTTAAAVLLFIMAGLAVYAFLSMRTPHAAMSALTAAILILLSIKALPLANSRLQGTLHRFSLTAKELLRDGGTLITSGINNPSVVYYSDHRIVKADTTVELLRLLKDGRRAVIIARSRDLAALEGLGLKLISRDDTYAILNTQ